MRLHGLAFSNDITDTVDDLTVEIIEFAVRSRQYDLTRSPQCQSAFIQLIDINYMKQFSFRNVNFIFRIRRGNSIVSVFRTLCEQCRAANQEKQLNVSHHFQYLKFINQ